VSLSYDEMREEEEEGGKLTIIRGNDHYARFYRYLKARYPWLTPENYKDALEQVDSVFDMDYEIDGFFTALCNYVKEEVSKLIPDESKYLSVDFEYYHERGEYGIEAYKLTEIVAYVNWNLGGKERKIEVYREEIAKDLSIAATRGEFNELIDALVKNIAAEASAVVKNLREVQSKP